MELCEAHWCRQNAAAQGRTVKGQDRGAVGQHQERAPTCPVILPSTNCRLYYRLVSNSRTEELPVRSPFNEGARHSCKSNGPTESGFLKPSNNQRDGDWARYGSHEAKGPLSVVARAAPRIARIAMGLSSPVALSAFGTAETSLRVLPSRTHRARS